MQKHDAAALPFVAKDRDHSCGYSLLVEHPRSLKKRIEVHPSMTAVVARAAELIRAGYNIGIWSSAFFEKH